MIDYKYAYLLGNLLVCFPVWLLLFLRRRDLRKEVLVISFIGGLLGPIAQIWYLRDYWRPELFNGWIIGFEDFLFGFFISGIASFIYEEVFGKRFARRKTRESHWYLGIVPIIILAILLIDTLTSGLGMNSIYASIVIFFAFSSLVMFIRRDLIPDALVSGIILGIFMILGYFVLLKIFPDLFSRFWFLENISGVSIFEVPIEEFLWAFTAGMFIGPLYEFLAGLKYSNSKS